MVDNKMVSYLQGHFLKILVSERLVGYVMYGFAKQLRETMDESFSLLNDIHHKFAAHKLNETCLFSCKCEDVLQITSLKMSVKRAKQLRVCSKHFVIKRGLFY